MMIIMTEDRIAELRALCAEYEKKKESCEAAGLKTKAADIAADGVGRKALEAMPELLDELEYNNSTPREWLMRRFTEVK